MSEALSKRDLHCLHLVACGVKNYGNGWVLIDDRTQRVDGRTLARLKRLGLIYAQTIGVTYQASVKLELTQDGRSALYQDE